MIDYEQATTFISKNLEPTCYNSILVVMARNRETDYNVAELHLATGCSRSGIKRALVKLLDIKLIKVSRFKRYQFNGWQ